MTESQRLYLAGWDDAGRFIRLLGRADRGAERAADRRAAWRQLLDDCDGPYISPSTRGRLDAFESAGLP